MKTTAFLHLIAVCVVGQAAPCFAQAQGSPPPQGLPVEAAKQQYQEANDRVNKFLQQPREGAPRSEDQEQRKKLRALLEETFAARQQLQQAELRELQRRLDAIGRAVHDRETHKEVLIDARLDELLNVNAVPEGWIEIEEQQVRGSDGKVVTVRRRLPAGQVPQQRAINEPNPGRATYPAAVHEERPMLPQINPAAVDDFDIDTRERLVEIDAQTAQEDLDSAAKTLSQLQKLDKEGAVSARQLREAERERRRAETELKRAKAKLEGIARQRTALRTAGDDFDIETREQLAEFDLEQATANRDVAESDYEAHRTANEKAPGSTPEPEMKKLLAQLRVKQAEVKRAKAKLAGFARQRSELQAAADAEVEQAEAAKRQADAKHQTAIALYEAGEAEVGKAEAQVESAQANVAFHTKQFYRIKNLAEAKSVTQEKFDEAESQYDAARGALQSAQAAVVVAKAKASQLKAAIEESVAEQELAESRLRTAKSHRDRLKRSSAKPTTLEGKVEETEPKSPNVNDSDERRR